MHAYERDQQSWNYKPMERKESRQQGAADNRPSQHQFDKGVADYRRSACYRRTDSQSPVSVLLEPQDLARKGHSKGHQEKEHTDDPGQLPRKLVRTEKEDLDHVNQNNRDHEVGAPTVQRTDEPAESHILIQI